ncbi:MAG: SGNH/GDSL hydrolase family protein, partial [Desulfobulbaceae bacterium]|nr:SGNH/GDSL hydrolase family protein [Desulfobulbaceae bacterium]
MIRKRYIFQQVIFQLILVLFLTGCGILEGLQDLTSQDRFDVLFIGNSYTSSNGLPDMFERMALSGGYRVHVAMVAPGGWTLTDHLLSAETLEKIRGTGWDFVVLQEQSVIPSLFDTRERQMYPAIRQVHDEIKAVGADTILFMTWGRRNGLPSEGHRDFASMQAALETGYLKIGNELNLAIAPVGVAWWNGLRSAPQLDLWVEDGSHPNREGTYLAACVLYGVIFGQSPE